MAKRPGALEDLALKMLFGGVYSGRNILVTGHTGFKGSWLCLWLMALGARVSGLALDPDTDPAHWSLLSLHAVSDKRLDLRDRTAVRRAIDEIRPEIIFHLAAQPLVRRSYREPLLTFETNVLGLVHLLDAVRGVDSAEVLINVTSDKVYRERSTASGYLEDDPLGGHDPYSTSKACSELVTESYHKSFFGESGPRVATVRAGNVIGGGDWSEDRLVPDFVRAASTGAVLHIRNPDAVRPWQHVLEPLSGYLRLGQLLLSGAAVEGAWNFGPAIEATISVKELVAHMQTLWPELRSQHDPGPHPREAPILLLDSTKAARGLQWRPVWNVTETLRHTIWWYHSYYRRGKLRSHGDLDNYVAAAAEAGLEWAK